MEINYDSSYLEPGYQAKLLYKDISDRVTVESNVNTMQLGEYEVDYYLHLGMLTVKETRKVKVVDKEAPVLTVEDSLKVCPLEEKPEIEYTAIDNYNGDITFRVNKTYSEDMIHLDVSDTQGNETKKDVRIIRLDDEAPVITLKGSTTVYQRLGVSYKEQGYEATDNCDGNITDKVTVENNIGSKTGTYTVTYKVTDESGNEGTATRTVVVVNYNLYSNGSGIPGTIYLTFDDGPGDYTTSKILDVLKEEGVKATFFVTCRGSDALIKRMYDEGHTVALHTASHDYSYVYSSTANYFADLEKVSARVERITGHKPMILRFPGGSSNTVSRNYMYGIMTILTQMVLDRGYHYFDWNVDSNDAGGAGSSRAVYNNVVNGLRPNRANIVLMHDIKQTTAGAIKDIIEYGKNSGYTFKTIDMDTAMVRHAVAN